MRTHLALLAPLAVFAAPDTLAPFEPALAPLDPLPATANDTAGVPAEDSAFELLRRQNNACATNYYACANLNAPGLCCPRTAICSADRNNAVACCPQGAACTGTLGGGGVATATANVPTTTAPFVFASTTSTGNPFVQQPTSGAATLHSTVQNTFYPFPYIATTYTNAAACSAAYTSCQGDAARCTAALANGAQGVTVSAPNGAGVTVTAVASLGTASAQSVCASLSSQACYGLNVAACARFDGNTGGVGRLRCGGMMAAGMAVGFAGQILR